MHNAAILLAHTAALATLGTLETGKHAQVRNLGRAITLEDKQRKAIDFCSKAAQRPYW